MQRRRALRLTGLTLAALFVASIVYGFVLSWQATREFDQRGWDLPARIYAAPLELYAGRRIEISTLITELERLGYARAPGAGRSGSFEHAGNKVLLRTRAFQDTRGIHDSRYYAVNFAGSGIRSITDATGKDVVIAELDPLPIGSLFPSHGEDRIVLAPDEVPQRLIEGIKAVEDRRFDDHIGVDLRGIARAAWVNLRAGSIEQGASTITQQLIRSYFLNQEQTFSRKLREAFMALALELQKGKAEIAVAYVNEVYLGQDGVRAIHGFGLAAQHYFGRPLSELELHELALLIGQVRGPSYYEPRRFPERARERRNLVLRRMHESGLIADAEFQSALQQEIGVTSQPAGGYFAGFIDLVRRQLREEYAAADLESAGLRIFATLDPSVQAAAERAVAREIDALQDGRVTLDTAIVITTPHDAEVKALIGGRQPGFNRALDAYRPVGSLIKPAVYLTALESGTVSLASRIADEPIEVRLENGDIWVPGNFEDKHRGNVTVARALAESLNMATVRLGMQVGPDSVSATLVRLGLQRRPAPLPSLLLGATELSPVEVATVYNTLANDGFGQPLRAVRGIVANDGSLLQRSGISIEQAANPGDIYTLNTALVEVMRSGTGKSVQRRLPSTLTTAGKTGTSDDLRDSWFAGYSGEHLAVVWIGNDDNEPIGLTGATGAGRLWAGVMGALTTRGFAQLQPAEIELAWIDLDTGLVTDAACPQAALLGVRRDDLPLTARRCGSERTRIGSRLRRFLNGTP
jgi:penicillin-binding protein 1B